MSAHRVMDLSDAETLLPYLEEWAGGAFGSGARVVETEQFSGHSGITMGFTVFHDGVPTRLVIKVPPFGVAQVGAMDVLAQVPVLRLMAGASVKVAEVVDFGAAGVFPVPYVISRRLEGRPPTDVFTGPLGMSREVMENVFDQAVMELAGIHSVRPTALTDWRNRSLREELDYWVPILAKAQDPEWVHEGMELHRLLLERMPVDPPRGVVHGDYYSNNWNFDDDVLTGILDWEGSSVGAVALDVGWMCLMYDKDSWGPTRRQWMHDNPSPEWLLARYEHHSGGRVIDIDWYRAAAGFRLAALTAYYLRLHRLGRRVDPVWELFGESFPHMVRRAIERCTPLQPTQGSSQ